ncbi:MAG: 3'-5' exonuclease [Candidatus Omnitrophica bacterium]|nr:3'-5' exonuclease [Candidatus Omnitrophota bacterium]
MQLKHPLVVLDLETTGTWIEKDKIIEIAMIKCFPDGQQLDYVKRINPGIPIPKQVSDLVGITDSDVYDAPPFNNLAREILDFIDDSDLAGFNVIRFDLPVLEREFSVCNMKFYWRDRKIYDAQKVFHLKEKRDLTAAYKFYCRKDLVGAHSALVDTQATLEVLKEQTMLYSDDKGVQELLKFEYQTTDDFYDHERRFRWWNGELYMTFGKHARKSSLQDVAKKDRKYLDWILSANFNPEVKSIVSNALNGYFPVKDKKD